MFEQQSWKSCLHLASLSPSSGREYRKIFDVEVSVRRSVSGPGSTAVMLGVQLFLEGLGLARGGDDIDLLKIPTPRWHEGDGGYFIGTGCMVPSKCQ